MRRVRVPLALTRGQRIAGSVLRPPFGCSAKIDGDGSSHWNAAQLFWRYEPRLDDLAVVEPQLGQFVQSQDKEVHPVSPSIPCPARSTGWKQPHRDKPNLLGQLTPRRSLGRFTTLDSATWEAPLGTIRGAQQQNSLIDVDGHERALVLCMPQPPPDAGDGKTNAERDPPGGVEVPNA